MNSFKIWLFPLCSMLLFGCSTDSSNEINYRDSVITPTLEIPPDLISQSSEKNLVLPGSKVGTAENTGRFVETGNLNKDSKSE